MEKGEDWRETKGLLLRYCKTKSIDRMETYAKQLEIDHLKCKHLVSKQRTQKKGRHLFSSFSLSVEAK